MKLKTVTKIEGEPTAQELDRIYMTEECSIPITVDGIAGTLRAENGGWGETAIIAQFGERIFSKCERESEDYEQILNEDETPNELELYDWQDEQDRYYCTLSNALAHRHGSNYSM